MEEHCAKCKYIEENVASWKCIICKHRGEKINDRWVDNFEHREPVVLSPEEIVDRYKYSYSNQVYLSTALLMAQESHKNGSLEMWLRFNKLLKNKEFKTDIRANEYDLIDAVESLRPMEEK